MSTLNNDVLFDEIQRIAPDQPGKLTDEELGKIGLQAANHTNHQTNFYQAFASAVRKEVEAAQAEGITRLIEYCKGLLMSLDDTSVKLVKAERIAESKHGCWMQELAKVSAMERQTSEILTAERDRLLPRPISIAPTKDDTDAYGKVLILGHERMACLVDINDWQIANGWTHWLPCSLGAYGITPTPAPTAEDVEREKFESAYRIESLKELPEGAVFDKGVLARAENGDYLPWVTRSAFRIWQAARAVKEGGEP